MWTYYRVAGEGYVRIDLATHAAEEFDPAESAWLPMDVWYDEIQFNGQGLGISEQTALSAVRALSRRVHVA